MREHYFNHVFGRMILLLNGIYPFILAWKEATVFARYIAAKHNLIDDNLISCYNLIENKALLYRNCLGKLRFSFL